MAKIKHTKNELKAQREALRRFERFLPMLQLKKMQLQMELQSIEAQVAEMTAREADVRGGLERWVRLFAEPVELAGLTKVARIVLGESNIAGVSVPVFKDVVFEREEQDLFATPTWLDEAVMVLEQLIQNRIAIRVLAEQKRLIMEELRTTSQRVNLFEKVKIPEAREHIRVIKIFLGDQQTAGVARAKFAKGRTADFEESGLMHPATEGNGGRPMIVPMKSVTLLCLLPDQDRTLTALRDLGVLHLTPVETPDSEDLATVQVRLAAAREAMDALAGPIAADPEACSEAEADHVVRKVQDLLRHRKERLGGLESLERERAALAPYGEFDPEAVRRLEAAGVWVKLLQVASSEPLPVIEGALVQVLSEDQSSKYLAIIARSPVEAVGREFPLPERALKAVDAEREASRRAMDEADRLMVELRRQRAGVEQRIRSLEEHEHFLVARDGMGISGRVSYIKGFCPVPGVEALRVQGRVQGWGMLIEDPGPDDPVPTLLHNPRWVQPIKAIFKMIGIVPGYRELDISAMFLVFYSVFFAMLVGDAGYGFLFLALTGAIRLFARKAPPELPRLLGTLSVCTIVWGGLTGSYFGIRFEALPPLLRQGRVTWLTDEVNLMALCFLIGSIHLTIAHVWNAWRVRNSLAALAQLGWVAITWTMYYLAMNMILGLPLPAFTMPLFIGGLVGVVVFMTPLRLLKTDWPNHAMLPLSIIGSFGDVVSYVRLFAVGSAGTAISVAFNDMALSGGISSFGAGVGAALILFLAHAMNILLSALGVIVHGVRLNTLEFSGHLGMQWTGIPFKPFRKQEPGQE